MVTIKTKYYGKLDVITIDPITGEGTNDIRLEIDSKYASAYIHLTEDEAKLLRDEINDWLQE